MAKKDIEEFLGISLITIKKFSSDMGSFLVTYEPGLTLGQTFYQDSISILKEKNTLKGMHLQAGKYAQSKLVTVIKGSILDFFVDLRTSSKTYLDYGCVDINEKNCKAIFIPPGFAHGYLTLKKDTVISYKLGAPYAPEHELTLKWDDPEININWPDLNDLRISDKDLNGLSLKQVQKKL